MDLFGYAIKEVGSSHWLPSNDGTNSSHFNARGAALRNTTTGAFQYWQDLAVFWGSDSSFISVECSDGSATLLSWSPFKQGLSVRPLKDSTTLSDGETGTYTGNDGKVYRTICIGTQEWLADNLAETKYRNGDTIPEVTNNTAWAALVTGAMCAYNNDWSNA